MKIKNGQRPQKTIKELSEEFKKSAHHIDKKQVSMKAAEGTGSFDLGGIYTPDDAQMARINEFTASPKTADQIACFNTMSCNDMYDRDDERFTTDTIDGFAALEAPFSFTGKSFMSDHKYEMASVRGRIFDTGTDTKDGVHFLVNSVYVPKTAQHADYLESVDFGLNWAVSVGVVVDKSNCSICDAQVFNSRFFGSWCANGHEKGYYYVPGEEEDDGWGFYEPVAPETKGAVKAMVDLSDPIDGYEISQVFLGAQYYAELAKKPGFAGVLKAASARTIPIIGLSAKEAEELDLPTEPEELQEARKNNYTVTTDSNGNPTWTDDEGLVWVYASVGDNNEVQCLGRSAEDGEPDPGEELRADGEEHEEDLGHEEDGVPAGSGQGDAPDGSEGQGGDEHGTGGEVTASAGIDMKAIIAAFKAAGLSDDELTVLDAGLPGLTTLASKFAGMASKAALGEKYSRKLRADAIAWYVKANKVEATEAVSTKTFEKILDALGDDVELVEEMIEEQRKLAQAKFPREVRRSTFEKDHNERMEAEKIEVNTTESRLPSVHRS